MRVKTLLRGASLSLILGACLPAVAQDASVAATNAQAQGTKSGGTQTPQSLTTYSGGPVKKIVAVTQGSQEIRDEAGGYQLVPGASVLIAVPPNTTDTIIATFSAECRLFGSSSNSDWVQIEIRDNTVPIEPTSGTADPVAFCSDDRWSMHSIQAVKNLGPGHHRIQVFWKLADFEVNDQLSGWLDDYALVVLQAD